MCMYIYIYIYIYIYRARERLCQHKPAFLHPIPAVTGEGQGVWFTRLICWLNRAMAFAEYFVA